MIRLAIMALWGVSAGLLGRVWWSQRRYMNWLEHRLKEAQREEERVQPSGWEAEKVDVETKWKEPSHVARIMEALLGGSPLPDRCPICKKPPPPYGRKDTETTEETPPGKPTSWP